MISEVYDFSEFVQAVQFKSRLEVINLIQTERNEGNERIFNQIDGKQRQRISGYVLRLDRLLSLLGDDGTGITKNYFDTSDLLLCRPLLENLVNKGEYSPALFNQLRF